MTPDQYRREGAEAMQEAAAKITEGGYRCMSCGQVFLNDNGHSDADCSQGDPNWDTATDAQKATAIRSIDVDEVLAGPDIVPDAVARLGEAMKHLHDIINCGNCSGSRQSARLALRALAAMETSHD